MPTTLPAPTVPLTVTPTDPTGTTGTVNVGSTTPTITPPPVPPTTDGKPATLEEALAALEKLQRHSFNKEEEASRVQKKLAKFEADEAERQRATMTETEKLKADLATTNQTLATLQAEYETERIGNAVYKAAGQYKFVLSDDEAAPKMRFIYPELVYNLLSEEDRKAEDLNKVLQKLAKKNPLLLEAEKPTTPDPITSGGPAKGGKKSTVTTQKLDIPPILIPKL
jgi:hypothetical protein